MALFGVCLQELFSSPFNRYTTKKSKLATPNVRVNNNSGGTELACVVKSARLLHSMMAMLPMSVACGLCVVILSFPETCPSLDKQQISASWHEKHCQKCAMCFGKNAFLIIILSEICLSDRVVTGLTGNVCSSSFLK